MTEKVPIIVVLGIDVDGRPHASRFDQRDARVVRRAAELMDFHVIRVPAGNTELHAIAEKLPLGKIFASGRGFVPFVARTAFDKLATLVEGGVNSKAQPVAGEPPVYPAAAVFAADAVNAADALWSKVEIGTVVLAEQSDVYGPGWWEGVVVGVDGDTLILRWVENSTEEPFRASRRDVALRHPGAE